MRWGIIGTGFIAAQFARDITVSEGSNIRAVCSRSRGKAAGFAEVHHIPAVYDDLSKMLSDDRIDNIYIAVPNSLHKPMALAAVAAGKNVLCEKPLGVNAGEVHEILAAAKKEKVLFMEGLWTRFFPAFRKALELAGGQAGELRFASVDLGYDGEIAGERGTWHFDRRYGAGALMDMGVYAVFLSIFLFGKKPDGVSGHAFIENGIDEYNAATLVFGKRHAVFTSSIVNETACAASIICSNGTITLPRYWWRPDSCVFIPKAGEPATYSFPFEKEGLQYEIEAFEDAAKKGLAEHPFLPHDYSLGAAETIDALRSLWGVRYAQD